MELDTDPTVCATSLSNTRIGFGANTHNESAHLRGGSSATGRSAYACRCSRISGAGRLRHLNYSGYPCVGHSPRRHFAGRHLHRSFFLAHQLFRVGVREQENAHAGHAQHLDVLEIVVVNFGADAEHSLCFGTGNVEFNFDRGYVANIRDNEVVHVSLVFSRVVRGSLNGAPHPLASGAVCKRYFGLAT